MLWHVHMVHIQMNNTVTDHSTIAQMPGYYNLLAVERNQEECL